MKRPSASYTRWSVAATGRRLGRLAGAITLAVVLAVAGIAGQQPDKSGQQARPGKSGVSDRQRKSLVKLAEPWPDAKTLAKRRADAEKRRLFQSSELLQFTLAADFKKVNGDRSATSRTLYPATLTTAGKDGQPIALAVQIRGRGTLRRNVRTCGFPPLRIEFSGKDKALKRSVFDGHKDLKLVTHCTNDYEQYVVREYLAYRAYNLISPFSLRVRLAKGTYIDAINGKTITTRLAFFIEADEDLAKRVEGRPAILPRSAFADHDMDTLTQMALFQFMVGNTDYSIFVLHNASLVKTRDNRLHAIPYDFDVSGLVNPPYALPAVAFHLQSVRDRLYRGPCRTAEELEPLLARFRAKKDEILKLYADQPELNKGSKDDAREYLEEFFGIINDKGRTKRRLVDVCSKGIW